MRVIRHLESAVDSFLRNTNIQNRLIFSFVLLSLLPLSLTGFLSYYKSSRAMDSKTESYLIQMMNEVSKNIRVKMEKIEAATDEVYLSKIVQNNIPLYGKQTDEDTVRLKYEVNSYLSEKFSIVQDVQLAEIFDGSGNLFTGIAATESIDVKYQASLAERFPDLRQLAIAHRGAVVWTLPPFEDQKGSILLVREINSLITDKAIATLVVAIKNRYLSDAFEAIDIGKGSNVFVVDAAGDVISSQSADVAAGSRFSDGLGQQIADHERSGKQAFDFPLGGQGNLAVYAAIGKTSWYLVSMMPYTYLNAESRKIGVSILIITSICFVSSIYLSYMISRSIYKPLKKLIKAMNATREGNLASSISDTHKDELAVVTGNFDRMVTEIRHLVHNVKRQEDQKRLAELKALQAQINPHFLSNTLNTVRWLAQKQKAHNIDNLVTSLIQLLHVSMGKGDDLITLREEIEYLNNYANIQKYRYSDMFELYFEIEDDALDCRLLKFLLQPFVENSLIHGIGEKGGQGVIIIKGRKEEGRLRITITDDGAGMSEDRLAKVMDSGSDAVRRRSSGMGVKNVDDRIKLFFGEGYGIAITSVPLLYTTVEVIIPILEGEGEDAQSAARG